MGQKDGKTIDRDDTSIVGENAQIKNVDIKGADLTFTLTGPAGDNVFQGKLAKAGPDAGKYLGRLPVPGCGLPREPGEDDQ